MTEFTDMMDRREAEVRESVDRLRVQLAPLEAELREITRARVALESAMSSPAMARLIYAGRPRIKAMIVEVLSRASLPQSPEEIRTEIDKQFGFVVVRTTFSPQLSRLVREGKVLRTESGYTLLGRERVGE